MSILYISGPMTGYETYNFPAFFDAAKTLEGADYDVLNPALNPPQSSWEGYLRLDIPLVCQADGVAVLPGWETSAGAALEVHVAQALRIPVLPVDRWVDLASRQAALA